MLGAAGKLMFGNLLGQGAPDTGDLAELMDRS